MQRNTTNMGRVEPVRDPGRGSSLHLERVTSDPELQMRWQLAPDYRCITYHTRQRLSLVKTLSSEEHSLGKK